MSRSLKTNMSPFFRFPKCPKRSWPQHGERSRSGAAGAKRGAGDFLGITSDFFGQIYHHNIYVYIYICCLLSVYPYDKLITSSNDIYIYIVIKHVSKVYQVLVSIYSKSVISI